MKSRKKPGIILALTIALPLLLISCEKQTEANQPFFSNSEWGCALGDRFYSNYFSSYFFMNAITVYTPEDAQQGLCSNPTCLHDGTNGICPDDTRAMQRIVSTDGERLYISMVMDAYALGDTSGSGPVCQIWSLNPDGSDFRLISSRTSDGRGIPATQAGGGYLWYPEWRNNEAEGGDYRVLMRVPTEGGEVQQAFDQQFPYGLSFAVKQDGSEIAMIQYTEPADLENLYSSAGRRIEITEFASGGKTVIPPPAEDVMLVQLQYACGSLWLEARRGNEQSYIRDSGEQATEARETVVLYRLEDGAFTEVAQAENGSVVYGPDAVWYAKSDREYLGTKPMATGGAGGTQDFDFFLTKNLTIGCIRDEKITEHTPGEGIGSGKALNLMAAADGVLYGTLLDEQRYFDTDEYVNNLIVLDAQTLDVVRDYGELVP